MPLGATMRGPDWGERPELDAGSEVDLNLTSLVDVVFALLIVFMMSSAAMIEQGRVDAATGQVDLSLPAGQTAASKAPSSELVVQIDADGNMFEAGAPMDQRSLGLRVLEKLKGAPDLQVRVEADQKLTYERVMAVISRLQELGVRNVGLATRTPAP